MVGLPSEDWERLAQHFMAKHRRIIGTGQLDDFNLYGLIVTVIADTLLVAVGDLTVDNFKPDGAEED